MMFDLSGKRVAVFGGSSGIGLGVARLSMQLGAIPFDLRRTRPTEPDVERTVAEQPRLKPRRDRA